MEIVHKFPKNPGRHVDKEAERKRKRRVKRALTAFVIAIFATFWGYQLASLISTIHERTIEESKIIPVSQETPAQERPEDHHSQEYYEMKATRLAFISYATIMNPNEILPEELVMPLESEPEPVLPEEEFIEPELPPQEVVEEETPEEIIEEEIVEEPEEVIIDFYQEDFNRDSYVMCSSGLTADQIEGMLEDYSGLDGLGEAIYLIEEEYGVNAFYTLGVASLESGFGTSYLARNKNNLFGLMGCSFSTKSDCVDYFGRLMVNYQEKHNITMTPNGINPRYCESDDWAKKVTSLMNQWAHLANDMY